MKLPTLRSPFFATSAWRRATSAWRPAASAHLEIWLPRGWPALGVKEGAEPRWRRSAPGERVREGRGLEGLDGLAAAEDVVVWTPAAESLLLRAQLPTRSAAKIAQALPFTLEDHLIEPPEQLHFAFTREADGALAVAVTTRERIQGWLAALQAAGVAPTRLAPVTLSLPLADRAWTLAFGEDEMALRCGLHSGFGGPRESLPPAWMHAALAEARSENRAPERVLVAAPPADLDLAAWSEALALPVEALPAAQGGAPDPSLNLLQQAYAPRGRSAGLGRAYLPAAALLAAWLAGTLVVDTIEWVRLTRAARAGEEEMRALLMKSFPDTRVVLDAPEQMRRGLETLGAGTGGAAPGDLLALLARALSAIERESRARLQGFEYADRALTFRVAASDADAEAIVRALRARGLEVELQRSGGEAQLRVRAAPAAKGAP
jgi:general secretion pathway protein L